MSTAVEEPTPKVDGSAGGAAVGLGYLIKSIKNAVSGGDGNRFLAMAGIASFTWVATYEIRTTSEQQREVSGLLVRVGEDRVEREKADRARNEKELQVWYAAEREKERKASQDAHRELTMAFTAEQERNRSLILKLAGVKIPAFFFPKADPENNAAVPQGIPFIGPNG